MLRRMKGTSLQLLRITHLPGTSGKDVAAAMRPQSYQPAVSLFERGGVESPTDDWFERYTAGLQKLGAKVSESDVRRAHARTVGKPYRKPKRNPTRLARVA